MMITADGWMTTEDRGQNISRSSSMGYNINLHDDDNDGGGVVREDASIFINRRR